MSQQRQHLSGSALFVLATMLAAPASGQTVVDANAPDILAVSGPAPARATTPSTTKALTPLYRNVRPFYRNVRPFWGDVNPFYRNVRAFWGDVDPFYRNVRAFWGQLDPATMASAVDAPAYDGIGTFWNDLGARWDDIAGYWQDAGEYSAASRQNYDIAARRLSLMVTSSKKFWGASVEKQTGKSFEAAFVDPFMARYGIDLTDRSSLAKLDAAQQSQFFIEWYDGLMAYSGTDHVDWWMKAVNWTPKLTQTMGSGAGSTLGLVDDYSAKGIDILAKVDDLTKKNGSAGGHGEGVLSLIVSKHDGKGVMGIAPGARVVAYNPFDRSGGAGWGDVSSGIQAVAKKGATVINLSLGAPGVTLSSQWQQIFTKSEINTHKDKTLYIIAAGNDGVTQSGIVDMKGALDTTFIVVGSVGPDGISEFSNRPGTTCLTDGGTECKASSSLKESGYLMNRFIVAPGELILVADGSGGLTRQSGTSLSAPLVAGAVALIQDRWPWMREKPRDIAMVILGSAKDLGAPGIDPVYGVGMLDIEAAMSPLDFGQLKYYLTSRDGKSQNEVSVSALRSGGMNAAWANNDMYFTAFEKLDQVERDFLIPLSTRLHGMTRKGEYFQDFVYNRMARWIATPGFASSAPLGFSDTQQTAAVDTLGGWTMNMTGRIVTEGAANGRLMRPALRSSVAVVAPSGRFGFSFGQGDGALALGAQPGLALASDLDPDNGGVNPLLGFASGGAHAAARFTVATGIALRAGTTERRQNRALDLFDVTDPNDRALVAGLTPYTARASTIGVDYDVSDWLRLSATATSLHEPNAFLGVRSIAPGDFAGGTTTTGTTFGAHLSGPSGLSLFGSGTMARGRPGDGGAGLRVAADGTAFQAGVAKQGLFGRNDALRLSVAQPLRFANGAIELTEVQVIDRQTGEKGVVTQRYDIGATQPRRLVVQGNYGAPALDGRAEVSMFARGEVGARVAEMPQVIAGTQLRLIW